MKQYQNSVYTRLWGTMTLSTVMAVVSVSGAFADRSLRLDAGSVIPVRLNDSLSSTDSRKGDTFTATLRNNSTEDSYGLPAGTKVEGVVKGVRPQQDKEPGVIEVSFDRMRLPDGHSYPIEGSLIGLDNKSVERRSDGRLVATPSHRNDRLTYAGYGAGAGLIVGLLTKRPLEDALLGGLLGYGFSALQKNSTNARNVVLKPGTEMGVRIDRRVSLTTYGDDNSYRSSDIPRSNNNNRDINTRDNRSTDNRPDFQVTGGRINNDGKITDDNQDFGTSSRNDVNDIGVMVDDRNVNLISTARPYIGPKNVVMVPVAAVLSAARVPFTYDNARQTLSATGTANPVRVALGSSIAIVNGNRRVRLDAPVRRLNGTLYAPMKFLELATSYDVTYDSGSKTVVMTSR